MILVGMMGSGKTAVGKALAARLGCPFVDNDVLIERATGRTARQILAEDGVHALRQAESSALRAGLEMPAPVVMAVAAGVVLDRADRSAIDGAGFVVWLRAPAEVLAARAQGAEHRPWLEDDPLAWFQRTLAERDALYASVADMEVGTHAGSAADAAERIVSALETDIIGADEGP